MQQFSQNAISSEIGADSSDIDFLRTPSSLHDSSQGEMRRSQVPETGPGIAFAHPLCRAISTKPALVSSYSQTSFDQDPASLFSADILNSENEERFLRLEDTLEEFVYMTGDGDGLLGPVRTTVSSTVGAGNMRLADEHRRHANDMQHRSVLGGDARIVNGNLRWDARAKKFVATRERRAMSHHEKHMRQKAKQASNVVNSNRIPHT